MRQICSCIVLHMMQVVYLSCLGGEQGNKQEHFQAPVLLKNSATFAAQILQGEEENIYTMFSLIGKLEALWGPWNPDKSLLHPPSMLHNCLLSITVLCVLHKLQPTSFICLHLLLCCYITQISLQWVEFGRPEVHKSNKGNKGKINSWLALWLSGLQRFNRPPGDRESNLLFAAIYRSAGFLQARTAALNKTDAGTKNTQAIPL